MRTLLLSTLLLLAAGAEAATTAALEAEVLQVAGERDRLLGERAHLLAKAGELAARIERAGEAERRAGADLTRQLREFDRLASSLDGLERRLLEQGRRLERLRVEFTRTADAEEGQLEEQARKEGAGSLAPAFSALAEARRRVAALSEVPRFRPPLEVSWDPQDGPAELETKLQVVDGERSRLAGRLQDLHGEEKVLAARLQAGREWARDLGAARRDAAGGVELLERAHEQAEQGLRALAARIEAVSRELAQVRQWDARLGARRGELERGLRSLEGLQGTP